MRFVVLFTLLAAIGVPRQASPDRVITGLPIDRPAVEPHLAASPTDPGHLLGAAIIADSAEPFSALQTCATVVTFDAGKTWQAHTFDVTNCGDPWVAVGWDGDAWFSALGRREGITGQRLFVYRSEDGGRTWQAPTDFGTGHDHQTMVLTRPASAAKGTVYVLSGRGQRENGQPAFKIFIGRSEDRGRTWLEPVVLAPSNLNTNALAGAVLGDGRLLAPFMDVQRPPFNSGDNMLARRRAWVYRSGQSNDAFSPPLLISEDCAAGRGFASLVAVTGTTRAIFICGAADGRGVLWHASEDGGTIWSKSNPIDAAPEGVVQRTASIASSAKGAVAITWLDSREAGPDCFRLRGTVSTDGGLTFAPARMLSSAPSCPQSGANGAAAKRWAYSGDYSGLAAAADGRFYALWADSRSGIYQLHFTVF
jgi:hypothetical protein